MMKAVVLLLVSMMLTASSGPLVIEPVMAEVTPEPVSVTVPDYLVLALASTEMDDEFMWHKPGLPGGTKTVEPVMSQRNLKRAFEGRGGEGALNLYGHDDPPLINRDSRGVFTSVGCSEKGCESDMRMSLLGGKWIDVDLTRQLLTAYVGETAVYTSLVSSGLPATPTPVGQYRIWIKLRYADMSGPGYSLSGVPFTMYFFEGYGLHAATWHNNFGHPMSHGCVNLPPTSAEWLFNWASVGAVVIVHEEVQ